MEKKKAGCAEFSGSEILAAGMRFCPRGSQRHFYHALQFFTCLWAFLTALFPWLLSGLINTTETWSEGLLAEALTADSGHDLEHEHSSFSKCIHRSQLLAFGCARKGLHCGRQSPQPWKASSTLQTSQNLWASPTPASHPGG